MSFKHFLLSTVLFATPVLAQSSGPIDPQRMSDIVKTLAADDFEGRAPGTPGEDKSVAYLADQFAKAGLAPAGENGTFIQTVPLIRTRIGDATVTVTTRGGPVALQQLQQIYFSTVRDTQRLTIKDAPLVFVGYGTRAPERNWDDFKGVDLKGKIAVFLVNDPDFEAVAGEPVANTFGGKRMTYYGRWTYKYEEAARQGAIGALIVHDTPGAGYGWSTVTAPHGENYDIVRTKGDYRVLLQGWLEGEAANALFAKAGLDLPKLRIAARRADFKPVAMTGAALSVDTHVTADHVQSRNLIGKIAGTTHADETIMFGAHWDAYGTGTPDATGRTVRAGAADDAIGVAGVLELARAFAHGPQPQRTLLFSAWTGEERGLLGSEHYAAHPLFPLDKTVANLTMDVLQTAGPAHDVVLVGDGQSDLEDRLAAAAKTQNRTITPEALPERGLFFRADHFSFARRGVPSLLLMGMSGGHDLVDGGRTAGDAWLTDYMKCYHQACDVWKPTWDLRGAAQDVALFYDIGVTLANSRDWPDWRPGTEFKAMRAASASSRR